MASTALSLAPGAGRSPGTPVAAALDVAEAYREHYAFVWRLIRHLGVPAETADDAVQDVFVVVSRRADTYQVGTSARAWLTVIARNVVHDHRKLRWRRVRRLRAIGQVWAGRTDDGDIARADAARVVQTLLDSLPEEQRLVLALSDLEGWTAPEIAEGLSLGVNTVYSRLRSARLKLEAAVAKGEEMRNG